VLSGMVTAWGRGRVATDEQHRVNSTVARRVLYRVNSTGGRMSSAA
jgi:hypothetical protein